MLSEILHTASRARAAGRNATRRAAASLARYAVVGLAALSVLPVPFPLAGQPLAAKDQSNAQGGAEPARTPEQQAQAATPADQNSVPLPPKVNTRPFKDLLAKWGAEYRAGRFDAGRSLDLTLEADRATDGGLTSLVVTGGSASDPTLVGLAKDAAITISASHVLKVLEGAPRVRLKFRLDQQKLSAALSAELESEERAGRMASVYGVGVVVERTRSRDTDAGIVLNHLNVSSSGKVFTVTLDVPRETLGNLLLRQITPN